MTAADFQRAMMNISGMMPQQRKPVRQAQTRVHNEFVPQEHTLLSYPPFPLFFTSLSSNDILASKWDVEKSELSYRCSLEPTNPPETKTACSKCCRTLSADRRQNKMRRKYMESLLASCSVLFCPAAPMRFFFPSFLSAEFDLYLFLPLSWPRYGIIISHLSCGCTHLLDEPFVGNFSERYCGRGRDRRDGHPRRPRSAAGSLAALTRGPSDRRGAARNCERGLASFHISVMDCVLWSGSCWECQ